MSDLMKKFRSLTPDEFNKTIAGLSGLALMVAPIILKQGGTTDQAAEATLDLMIAVDAITEIKKQIYG